MNRIRFLYSRQSDHRSTMLDVHLVNQTWTWIGLTSIYGVIFFNAYQVALRLQGAGALEKFSFWMAILLPALFSGVNLYRSRIKTGDEVELELFRRAVILAILFVVQTPLWLQVVRGVWEHPGTH